MEGYTARLPYEIRTTAAGAAEIDPEALASLAIDCLDEMHRQVQNAGFRVAGVASSVFWHSLCGVDENNNLTTPLYHLLDTRSSACVKDVPDRRTETGCAPHSSYWPAKLLWLQRTKPEQFKSTARWIGFPEYLFLRLFGRARCSTSMISATGLWNQNADDYDQETLKAIGVGTEDLPDIHSKGLTHPDAPERELCAQLREAWPLFHGIPWFPAIGDGACNGVGSGAATSSVFSLMIGTTGAMRAVVDAERIDIPPGLWCYKLDRKRFVLGGALSNGGDVYAWLKKTLQMPRDLEARLDRATPGSHDLRVLPFFAGERSPHWRDDLRAAIDGLSFSTEPFDLVQAFLESVALSFRGIYQALSAAVGVPAKISASGGALLRSPGWTQMIADALERPIMACTETEASSRGAVVWALEQMGAIPNLSSLEASLGAEFSPNPAHHDAWRRLASEREELQKKLYGLV